MDTVAVAGAAAVGISSGGLTTPGNMPRGSRSSISGTAGSVSSSYSRPQSMSEGGLGGYGTGPMGGAAAAAGGVGGSLSYTGEYPSTYPSFISPLQPPTSGSTGLELGAPPAPRVTMTRPEVALCLLSEVACERDEELRPYLAALLHVAVIHADSTNATVRQEACQLLQYLMYTLACKPLEGQGLGGGGGGLGGGLGFGGSGAPSSDYARVASVIGYLQSLDVEPLWAWELPTLAHPWVASAGYVAAFVQIGKRLEIRRNKKL